MDISTSNIDKEKISRKILELFKPYHRGWHSQNCSDQNDCFNPALSKITLQVNQNTTILFLLPAFPAKSPNPEKTASSRPDLGEKVALRFLNELCKKISSIYAPGAHIIICSDGRVFNDLVQVPDAQVDEYMQDLSQLIQTECLDHLSTFKLDDDYDQLSYPAMRAQLIASYGEPLEALKSRIHANPIDQTLWNGIHRFIFEDSLHLFKNLSRNQVRTLTKALSYQVVQRSNAWSRLIQERFPQAVRLSIHPQSCCSEKLGIMLLKSPDQWATPWHRVVLMDQGEPWLVRQSEAIALGAKPVFIGEQFSHYEKLETISSKLISLCSLQDSHFVQATTTI